MVPLLVGLNIAAAAFTAHVPNANLMALYIHLGSWIVQFIGHGVFEGRAPALLDSLVQGA
jgi:uncharacterized membrane protein YGL010W